MTNVIMPKTKVQKQETVKDLGARLRGVKSLVFARYEKLPTKAIEALKKLLKAEGVGYVVVKKTLLKRALADAGFTFDVKAVPGNFATVLGITDEVAPARIVAEFRKQNEALEIVGGVLEGRLTSAADIKALALLPSKTELLARLVGSIQAPVSGFVNVLAGNLRGLVQVLGAIKEARS